jgi:glycosyltransferase involved in cell wall biosynthesis
MTLNNKTSIHIIAPDIWHKDAVGNFCLDLAMLLRQDGQKSALYAQYFSADETPEVADMEEFFAKVTPSDTIFLSYSIFDPYLDQIIALPNRKICYFHGVTPPELLEEFEPITAELCRKSQEQFAKIAQFDTVIANSNYIANDLSKYISDKKIEVSPPVFAARQFAIQPQWCEKDPGLFVVVGRIVPHKKIEDALVIFVKAREQIADAKMIIIGDAPNGVYSDFLRDEIDRLNIGDSVSIVGKVDDDTLRQTYLKATYLINASMHEGYGIPVLEAMHYGVFPIVRGGNAMEEVVGDQGQVFSIVSNYIFEPHLKNNKVTDIDIAYELQQSFQNLYKYIRSF